MNTDQAPSWLPSYLLPFVTISYPAATPAAPDSFPDSKHYDLGLLDGCLMISIIIAFAALRDVARLFILEPFARWWLTRVLVASKTATLAHPKEKANGTANGNGHVFHDHTGDGHPPSANGNGHVAVTGIQLSKREAKKMRKSVLRFAEQGWDLIYSSFAWGFGLYIHRHVPTRLLSPTDVWIGYPHIPLPGPIKFYYLMESAFYTHQILVINAEARRKDHWQMMTHHVITVSLMLLSYSYNCTRVGCLVMFIMDWCDIWLPLAKMIRYMGLTTLCDITFVFWMLSWAVTRHGLFGLVIRSAFLDISRLIPSVWDPERGYFMTVEVKWMFISMLAALEVLQIIWFGMILRIAWRVITGSNAEDSRSDDEDDADSSEVDSKKDR